MPPRKEKAPEGEKYAAWTQDVSAVLSHYGVDPAKGLSEAQVKQSRAKFGFNELDKEEGKPLWKLVLEQFDDPLVKARARGGARGGAGTRWARRVRACGARM